MKDLVKIEKQTAITTSFDVARVFGKRHSDVLRDIRNILADIDTEFAQRNFAFTIKIKHIGNVERKAPYYKLTKDGFTLLVMGYTGKKAMKFKIDYINAFNQMQKTLLTQDMSLIAEAERVCLQIDNLTQQLSQAGRLLSVGGRMVKPKLLTHLDKLKQQIQPTLEFDQ